MQQNFNNVKTMDLKSKVDELIKKSSKAKLSRFLGVSKPTLDTRIKNENWTINERKLLTHAEVNDHKDIFDKRDMLF